MSRKLENMVTSGLCTGVRRHLQTSYVYLPDQHIDQAYALTVKQREGVYKKKDVLAWLKKSGDGWPGPHQSVSLLLNSGAIINAPITSADVRRSVAIHGRGSEVALGRTQRKATTPADRLSDFITADFSSVSQTLNVDVIVSSRR
jgi:hypothetical protein